jgi:hypothetical protein
MSLFACLSPETTEASIHITHVTAAFAIGVAAGGIVLSFQQRNFRWIPFYVVLIATHPAWTIEARGGDCGYVARSFSILASALIASVLLCQALRPDISQRRFLVILCLISWAAYFFFWFVVPFAEIPLPMGGIIADCVQGLFLGVSISLRVALLLSVIVFVFWLTSRLWKQRRAA